MNQYPAGLVPMVMPQQYMVVPGAAMQLPPGMPAHHPHAHTAHAHAHAHAGALQPAGLLHHQQMAAQAAASHVAGAPVITSPVVTSVGAVAALPVGAQGMVSMASLPPHLAGIGAPVAAAMAGGSVPGLHQAVSGAISTPFGPISPLASAASPLASASLLQQHLQHPPQHLSSQLQQIHQLHQVPSMSQQSLDFNRKKDDNRGPMRGAQRWQTDPELNVDELNLDESQVVLDHFNSDLNLTIDSDGHGGTVLNDPPGFCFTWAGARATYGVCRGKVFYEVHVIEHLPVDFGDDHNETNPHITRVGWSIDSSSFQLGEEPWSFGYGGTGKFSTNNRFSDYGVRFEEGDVIGAMLDLDSRPAAISYMKNGTWYGVAAPLHGFPVGSKEMALYPHILSKNCRFKVNFGQQDPWFPPPMGFRYIGQLQMVERVRGMPPPARKADCEMIMIVGLPGAGKTTWGINMQKNHPEKRYNIIGTDTLIDKMRVMGLPRKRNYHGRWEVLIDKSTKCLNKLFTIAAKRKRNYILDQTNVYGSARRRKMKNFTGFFRIAAVLQPDDPELERRSKKRTQEDGKVVPESAVLEMKANLSLPEDKDNLFDRIDYVELPKDIVSQLVRSYNSEGKSKPRTDGGNRKPNDQRATQPYSGYSNQSQGYGRMGSQNDADLTMKREVGWYPDRDESASKRMKGDPGSALDLLKQQYEEEDRQQAVVPSQIAFVGRPGWPDPTKVKEELTTANVAAHWPSPVTTAPLQTGYPQSILHSHAAAAAFQPGLLGAPPLPPGVQLAFLPPGMPPPAPHELAAGFGLAPTTAKAVQDVQGQASMTVQAQMQAQFAQAQVAAAAAAVQSQILVDPTKMSVAASPFAFVSQTAGPGLFGMAPPGYEASLNEDHHHRRAWPPASEHQIQTHVHVGQQHLQASRQLQSWLEQEESYKVQSKSWQDKPASTSWPPDWHNDSQQDSSESRKKSGNRDSSYGRSESRERDRDRDRDRERDRDRDRDRHRDRDSGYGSYSRENRDRNKSSDRGSYGGSGDRRDNYNRDSSSLSHHQSNRSSSSPSWNQGFPSSSSSDRQDYGGDSSQKSDRQRRRKSKWDQPDEESATSESLLKSSDAGGHFTSQAEKSAAAPSLFNQPPPGFPTPTSFSAHPPFSSPTSQSARPAIVSSASSQSPSKPQFDINVTRPPPPLISNLKSEFGPPRNSQDAPSSSPDTKISTSGSGDGLLGQGPGPRPLIPGLQGSLNNQFRPRAGSGASPTFRPPAPDGAPRRVGGENNAANGIKTLFSSDKSADEANKRPAPKPLIQVDDKKPEGAGLGGAVADKGPNNPNTSRGGLGKPGLFPTPGSVEADGPPRGPVFGPRGGPAGVMGRFPGPANGPPLGPGMPMPGGPGGPGGPPPPGMGPCPPRGGPGGPMGPRGPPRMGGPMGGPMRNPMGGPPRGPRGPGGPGPWNQNRPPRFGPRGPQGPPRPLFDGPLGRWPRPPR